MTMTTPECLSDYSVFHQFRYSGDATVLSRLIPHPVRDGLITASSSNPRMPMYDVTGMDFISKNFADEYMPCSFASKSQFYDVTFLRCNLSVSQFDQATFSNVRFWDCILDYADFADANLTDVCFQGSSFQGDGLNGAHLTRVCHGHTHIA